MKTGATEMSLSPTMTRFHSQHADLYGLIETIQALLSGFSTDAPTAPMREAFHQLSAKLRIHLALEDDALYPRLMRHPDARLRDRAEQFQTEMSGLRETYETFLRDWLHSGRFAQNRSGFVQAVRAIFGLLTARLRREDADLYPLVSVVAA